MIISRRIIAFAASKLCLLLSQDKFELGIGFCIYCAAVPPKLKYQMKYVTYFDSNAIVVCGVSTK